MATTNDGFANFFTKLAGNINSKIEPNVRYHLVKVYSCLTATTLCAAVGAFVHLFGIWEAGLLSALGSLGLVLLLSTTVDNPKNFYTRLGMLLGFGLLSGHSLGPLLDHVIAVNPQIVMTGKDEFFFPISLLLNKNQIYSIGWNECCFHIAQLCSSLSRKRKIPIFGWHVDECPQHCYFSQFG